MKTIRHSHAFALACLLAFGLAAERTGTCTFRKAEENGLATTGGTAARQTRRAMRR